MPLPLVGILTAIELGKRAFDVIAGFSGNAQLAKASGTIQDAISVINAVTPLVNQFANGQDVTPEDVRAALAGKDAALQAFDEMIAAKAAPGT